MKTHSILKQFEHLSLSQKRDVYKQLEALLYSKHRYLAVRQDILDNEDMKCPHCRGNKVIRYGTHKGQTRYKCNNCKRTFNELTGTSISCVKKKQHWERCIKLLMDGWSVRDIANELDIAINTALFWRHKILASLETIFSKQFKGIVETDDVFFKFNQKGRKRNYIRIGKRKRGVSKQQMAVMFTSDRYGTMDMKVTKMGRINQKDLEGVFSNGRLNKHNLICSDRHRTISAYFKAMGYEHKTIYSSKKQYVIGKYHVNHVNNLVSRFRRWMKKYHGVSSKYLQNYLNLFMMLEILKHNKNGIDDFLKYSLKDDMAVKKYKSIELQYQQLLAVA